MTGRIREQMVIQIESTFFGSYLSIEWMGKRATKWVPDISLMKDQDFTEAKDALIAEVLWAFGIVQNKKIISKILENANNNWQPREEEFQWSMR